MLKFLVLWLCCRHILESNRLVGVSRGETGLSIVGVVNLVIVSVVNHCTVLMVVFRGAIALLAWKWKKIELSTSSSSLLLLLLMLLKGLVLITQSSLSLSLFLLYSLCRIPSP
jgi:hypothetical protein